MKKFYLELERIDPVTKEKKDTRTISVPANLYEPFMDVLGYLTHPLRELFGADVDMILGDPDALVKFKELALSITTIDPDA